MWWSSKLIYQSTGVILLIIILALALLALKDATIMSEPLRISQIPYQLEVDPIGKPRLPGSAILPGRLKNLEKVIQCPFSRHFTSQPFNLFPLSCLSYTREKPYTCSQCSKSFATSANMKRHIAMHTGERPHPCAVCGKSFADKGGLRKHQRTHTGVKPHKCSYCMSAFTTRKRHMLDMHKEKSLTCDVCGEMFGEGELQQHQQTHVGEEKLCYQFHRIIYNTKSGDVVEEQHCSMVARGDFWTCFISSRVKKVFIYFDVHIFIWKNVVNIRSFKTFLRLNLLMGNFIYLDFCIFCRIN